jgi:outer membrane protein assembly factor BamB
MLHFSLAAIAVCVLLSPATSAQETAAPADAPETAEAQWAQQWTQWQGPTRDGVSTETVWSVTGRPDPHWTAEVGVGYSSVAIADGRLFTLGFDEAGECDIVWCLDPETGEEIWIYTFPSLIHANFHGGGTLTTPVIDGDRLYTSSRFGRVFCFDVESGEVLWERDYGTEFSLRINFHGCSSSPLLLGERLILTLSGVTFAVNKMDGEILWQTPDSGEGGYSNPLPFDLEGRACLVVLDGTGLSLHDLETGEQLQFHEFPHSQGGLSAATPIVIGTRVFISAAYNRGAALIELGGEEPDFVWYCRRMRNKVSGCVSWNDHLFGFDESMLKCIDMEGKECWRVRGLGMGTVSLADGKLLVLSSKGELIVAEANGEEFVELSRRKVLDGGVYWTAPVLLNGLIYCRNSLGQLVCLDHRAQAVAGAGGDEEIEGALPEAAELFAGHVEATGGEAAWRERRSMSLEGSVEITGAGITRTPMDLHLAAPTYRLFHFSIGRFGDTYRGWDGAAAWQLDPFYGNLILEGDALREVEEIHAFHAALDWREIYTEWKTVARASFAGHSCWKVDARSKRGAKRSLYFDVETGLKIGRSGEQETQAMYADYRAFEGLLLPTRITLIRPDTGEEEVQYVDRVTFDEVNLSLFDRPENVVQMLWTPEEIAEKDAEAREKYAPYLGTYLADFEPYENAEFLIDIARGDLVMTIPGTPPFALHGPDAEGWFIPGPGDRLFVRFEEIEDGLAETMHLRLTDSEPKLSRKRPGENEGE